MLYTVEFRAIERPKTTKGNNYQALRAIKSDFSISPRVVSHFQADTTHSLGYRNPRNFVAAPRQNVEGRNWTASGLFASQCDAQTRSRAHALRPYRCAVDATLTRGLH